MEFLNFIINNFQSRYLHVIPLLIGEILFNLPIKFKKNKGRRIAISLTIFILLSLLLPDSLLKAYVTIPLFFASLFLCLFTFDGNPLRITFNCVGACGTQCLIKCFSSFIYAIFQFNNREYKSLLDIAFYILFYFLVYFLVIKKCQNIRMNISLKYITLLSLLIFLVSDIFSKIAFNLQLEEDPFTQGLLIIIIALALTLQYISFFLMDIINKRNKLELIVNSQQEQYRLSQETIDIVNIKCHDLKHQIEKIKYDLKSNQAAKNDSLSEIEDAIDLYDNVVKTGNETLDTILTQKNIKCSQYKIDFNFTVDGGIINFMNSLDVYTLIANALDNAIECEIKEDTKNRFIDFKLFKRQNFVIFHIVNFCSSAPKIKNGLPITSKSDVINHGFGIQSMKYIANKYNGSVNFKYEKNYFSVDIIIPLN